MICKKNLIMILFLFLSCEKGWLNKIIYPPGCTDEIACNYNPDASKDDESCVYPIKNFDCDGECIKNIDCLGVCNGLALEDNCGECDSNPNNDCEVDCEGTWGGIKVIDCAGNCGGNAELDCTGICNGPFEVDCAGVCGGISSLDQCGECDGDGICYTYVKVTMVTLQSMDNYYSSEFNDGLFPYPDPYLRFYLGNNYTISYQYEDISVLPKTFYFSSSNQPIINNFYQDLHISVYDEDWNSNQYMGSSYDFTISSIYHNTLNINAIEVNGDGILFTIYFEWY